MPYLKQQIELVVNEIRAAALTDARFQSGRFEAIAIDVSRTTETETIETFPAVVKDNFEAVPVVIDDTYPIIIYNKILRKQHFKPNKDYKDFRGVRALVKMVCYGKRSALKITQEQLAAIIEINFPEELKKSTFAPLKLDSINVTIIDTNLNSAQLFSEEYKGFELFLSDNDLFFSINYQIETTFQKGCLNICDCIN